MTEMVAVRVSFFCTIELQGLGLCAGQQSCGVGRGKRVLVHIIESAVQGSLALASQ